MSKHCRFDAPRGDDIQRRRRVRRSSRHSGGVNPPGIRRAVAKMLTPPTAARGNTISPFQVDPPDWYWPGANW
jgi:hypothetical protein